MQQLPEKTREFVDVEAAGDGDPRTVALRFILLGDKIIAFPTNRGLQGWLSTVRSNPEVGVVGHDRRLVARARVKQISGLRDPLLSMFTRKYGSSVVGQHYVGQRNYVEISLSDERESLRELKEIYYNELEVAFDEVASGYDKHILGNPVNTWLRNVSVGVLNRLFREGETVLEIGCGTGTETLSLARRGLKVLAADISGKMLGVLKGKAEKAGLCANVVPIHSRVGELPDKIRSLGYEKLDGAYSTYGAINTEPDLGGMVRVFEEFLRDGARVLLGVWNRYCMFEILGYSLKLNPTLALARLKNPVPVGKSRFCVSSNAFTVKELDRAMGSRFRRENLFGTVVFLPPSNITRYLPKGKALEYLKKVDLNFGSAFPFNRLGDHFLAVYRKNLSVR